MPSVRRSEAVGAVCFLRVAGLRSIEEETIEALELLDKLAPPSITWGLRPLPWTGVFMALAERIFDLLGVLAPEFLRAMEEMALAGLLRLVVGLGWARRPFCDKLSKAILTSRGMETRWTMLTARQSAA